MQHRKARILCVDNHEDTCFLLATLFGRLGHEVMVAGGVGEALRLAGETHFDLYIIDKYYRDGSGYDLCRRLVEAGSKSPVIFFSGDARESARAEALRAGAVLYVVKPSSLKELLKAAEGLLARADGDDAVS